MENTQKGFIVPVLLVIIALLVTGGGAYVYIQSKQTTQSAVITPTAQTSDNQENQSVVNPAVQAASTVNNPTENKKITSTCTNISGELSYGSTDATTNGEVSALQNFLQSNGLLNQKPTGNYDNATMSAVKELQTIAGFNAQFTTGSLTGETGFLTRAVIKGVSCENILLKDSLQYLRNQSLSTANKKGNDATIKSIISNIRTDVSSINYNQNSDSCNTGSFFISEQVSSLLQKIAQYSGKQPKCFSRAGGVNGSYSISSSLTLDPTASFCVDSFGYVGYGTAKVSSTGDAFCSTQGYPTAQ